MLQYLHRQLLRIVLLAQYLPIQEEVMNMEDVGGYGSAKAYVIAGGMCVELSVE